MNESGAGGSHIANAVIDMLDADDELHDDAKLVVLAALDGDDQLAAALEGAYLPPRMTDDRPAAESEPVGAFVQSIEAQGFRGIGPAATLDLHPAPGLTIIAGRNGSGKSSFSEALELALTGDTYRWNKRNSSLWKEQWRNLHHPGSCRIRITLAEEGAGVTTIGVDWPDGSGLDDRTSWVQRNGSRREPGLGTLGWQRAVELYQPILSYDELGALLEAEPSKLFDKLCGILGIEAATDTQQRIANALTALEQDEKNAKSLARELKKALRECDDERAAEAYDQLRKHRPNIDTVEAIATGAAGSTGELAALRALTELAPPSEEAVSQAALALRSAATRMEELATAAVAVAARRAALLRDALEFHSEHGDRSCPVCGEGTLDTHWRRRIEEELSRETGEVTAHREACRQLDHARRHAERLLRSVLVPDGPDGITLETLADAQTAQARWAEAPDSALALAEHLESRYQPLADTFGRLRDEAVDVLQRYDDAWNPYAIRLANWVTLARKAREQETTVALVRAAHKFMQTAVERLRDRELQQLTGTAHEVWAALKAESNVDLGAVKLTGSNTRRRVELHAAVDGEDARALSVMSQGELHALALALFLPRATAANSPFRFVVLDDPIQAMDPAKVDGFVRVLTRLAEERQVIVFSHDDRLPQTVRQMGINARIIEVCRGINSTVRIEPCMDPARRYLDDAFAVASNREIRADIKGRVIPGLCRMAVEAAARDIYMARRFTAGDARAVVEQTWQETTSTSQRLRLALRGDKEADLSAWLNKDRRRRSGRDVVTKEVHEGLRGEPLDAVRDVERLVTDLRAGAR